MEVYKPSALTLQNVFLVCGMQLKYAEGFADFNAVRAAFNRRAYMAQAEMTECYEKQIHSLEQLLSTGVAIMDRINRESAEFAVSVLMYYGIETVTPEKMTTLHSYHTEKSRDGKIDKYATSWEQIFNNLKKDNLKPIQEKVKSITNFENDLSLQRQIQRSNRSRWHGGGFGFSGAVKGAMMAGMMNMGTSIFRGIGDSFVNAKDASRVQRLKNSIVNGDMPLANFNYIVKNYVMTLYEITKGYLCNTIGSQSAKGGIPGVIKYTISKQDIEDAIGKFSNYELFYKKGIKTASEVKQAIFEYMLTNIWDINALRSLYLLSESAEEKKSIIDLTPYLGLQYEFANIALNIDQDFLEEAEEKELPESELNRIRKETKERAELIDFLISSDDAQIESVYIKKKNIWKNSFYVENSSQNPMPDEFSQKDFQISKDNSIIAHLPYILYFQGSPFNGKIKFHGSDFIYDGDFKDGKFHGHARFEYQNGNTFEGEFENGSWVNGKLTTKNYVYNGNFIYDQEAKVYKRHGKGHIVYSDGEESTEGTFSNDKLHGYAKTVLKNGDTIEGTYKDGKLDGDVKVVTKNYRYDGKYIDNILVFITIKYSNGETYTGEILNTGGFGSPWTKSGNGTYTYANGQTYTGSWKDGKRHGYGTLTDKNGTIIYDGEWTNDRKKDGGFFSKLLSKF